MSSKVATSDFEVVDFALIKHEKIRLRPMYYELGFSNTPTMYGRKAILDRLLHALSFIPNHYGFVIWDIYRPREVQGRLFEWMCDEIKKINQLCLTMKITPKQKNICLHHLRSGKFTAHPILAAEQLI